MNDDDSNESIKTNDGRHGDCSFASSVAIWKDDNNQGNAKIMLASLLLDLFVIILVKFCTAFWELVCSYGAWEARSNGVMVGNCGHCSLADVCHCNPYHIGKVGDLTATDCMFGSTLAIDETCKVFCLRFYKKWFQEKCVLLTTSIPGTP